MCLPYQGNYIRTLTKIQYQKIFLSILKLVSFLLFTNEELYNLVCFSFCFAYQELLLLSHFSRVRLCTTPETRLPHPWDSPGKNSGVGCHFPLQCMKVKLLSHVRLFATPLDCSLPGSLVPGILQARTLEWVAISFSNA